MNQLAGDGLPSPQDRAQGQKFRAAKAKWTEQSKQVRPQPSPT